MISLAVTLLLRTLTPCVDDAGTLFWVRGFICPTGSEPASEALPNACDFGVCEVCPASGCSGLASMVMCCGSSGDGGCFEIISTTNECPWGSDLFYCDFGWCDSSGEAHCLLDP